MSWFISLCPLATTSSAMPVTPGTVLMNAYSHFWKTNELTNRPKGSLNHLNFLHGRLNVVNNELIFLTRPSSGLTWHPSE